MRRDTGFLRAGAFIAGPLGLLGYGILGLIVWGILWLFGIPPG